MGSKEQQRNARTAEVVPAARKPMHDAVLDAAAAAIVHPHAWNIKGMHCCFHS
jgi:hypothetical protein